MTKKLKNSGIRRGKTRTAEAMHQLGSNILNSKYTEGATLPPEDELAAELGVGRGTLREAVKVLVSKGLLAVSPRRGTTVLPAFHWHMLDPDVIQWADANPMLLDALSEFRGAIEPSAAVLAAKNITRLEAAHLLAAFERMENSNEWSAESIEADLDFHQKILEATHNPFFISLRHVLLNLLRISFNFATATTHREYRANMKLHEQLADAICAHDGEAARKAAEKLIIKHGKDIKVRMSKY